MFVLQRFTAIEFGVALLSIVVGSVIFSWLYNRTRGSLSIAVLAHAGVHLNNPTHALPSDPTPFVVYTLAIAVVAAGLVVFDRQTWTAGPATRRA
jgi:membrane protease YdiL (CAAX protease family)